MGRIEMIEGFKTLEEGQYLLGYVPRPVAVVCVADNPFAVAHHMLLSREPFMYGFSCWKENYSYRLLEKVADFSVNFLPYKLVRQIHITGKTHGNQVDKWELTGLKRQKGLEISSSIILDSLLIYECKVEKLVDFTDHVLVAGRVVLKHYRKGKLSPHKVEYPLFMGQNYYTTNRKGKKLNIDELINFDDKQ